MSRPFVTVILKITPFSHVITGRHAGAAAERTFLNACRAEAAHHRPRSHDRQWLCAQHTPLVLVRSAYDGVRVENDPAGSSGVAAAADRPRRARELERTPKNELSAAQVL